MKVQVQVEKTFVLTLNEEEALLIKHYIQNPHPAWKDDEPPAEYETRKRIFESLAAILKED